MPHGTATAQDPALRTHQEDQSTALDAWLRCTRTDTYAYSRIVDEPGSSMVVAFTAAAGDDPLAGAPPGVLEGRVRVERTEFSAVRVHLLCERVDAALDACDVAPVSSVTTPSATGSEVVVVIAEESAGNLGDVEGCLDAAELGEAPGRAQVQVVEGASGPS